MAATPTSLAESVARLFFKDRPVPALGEGRRVYFDNGYAPQVGYMLRELRDLGELPLEAPDRERFYLAVSTAESAAAAWQGPRALQTNLLANDVIAIYHGLMAAAATAGRTSKPIPARAIVTPRGIKPKHIHGPWIQMGDELAPSSGQGFVYRAHHKDDPDTTRVIKLLKNEKRIERLKGEIRALTLLDHPGIVKAIDSNLDAKTPYIVFPYYERGHLTKALAAGMSAAERFKFFAQVCEAVGFAHSHHVVHRDLKPANILIADDGSPVVADFGLCFFDDDDEDAPRPTVTEEGVGSRYYIAPELEDGRTEGVKPVSDVYALGKILYWLFAQRMFSRERHAGSSFDLRAQSPSLGHHYVYDILGKTVVERPEERAFEDAVALGHACAPYAERIAMEAPLLGVDIPQTCVFCRMGSYNVTIDPRHYVKGLQPPRGERQTDWLDLLRDKVREFPALPQPVEGQPWLVLTCGRCGNIQIFRLLGSEFLKAWGMK